MTMIIMLIALVAMTWFMQRQQKKQAQERQNQLNTIAKGDEIVTIGGLYGIVDEVDTEAQKMVLNVEGVYLTFELSALKRVVTKAGAEGQAITTDDKADSIDAGTEVAVEATEDVASAIEGQD